MAGTLSGATGGYVAGAETRGKGQGEVTSESHQERGPQRAPPVQRGLRLLLRVRRETLRGFSGEKLHDPSPFSEHLCVYHFVGRSKTKNPALP